MNTRNFTQSNRWLWLGMAVGLATLLLIAFLWGTQGMATHAAASAASSSSPAFSPGNDVVTYTIRARAIIFPFLISLASGKRAKSGSTISVMGMVISRTPVASITSWASSKDSGDEVWGYLVLFQARPVRAYQGCLMSSLPPLYQFIIPSLSCWIDLIQQGIATTLASHQIEPMSLFKTKPPTCLSHPLNL